MKPFWVYIVRCADGSFYTGHTDDLDRRIAQHEVGDIPGCYTFKRRPITLVFSQPCVTREEALAAELQIKGWSRKKKEAMMRGDWAEVSRLARSSATLTALRQAQGERDDGLKYLVEEE
jgi:putative endonuclease